MRDFAVLPVTLARLLKFGGEVSCEARIWAADPTLPL